MRDTDPSPSSSAPPNVVMIISDDQAWTDFGFMGHPEIATPSLDAFTDEAAVFPNGYVPTSLCRASLATLLTGLHGSQHKICCNDPPEGVDRSEMLPFMQEAPALPRLLREAGYASLQTGKFWEGHYRNAGFTHGMTTEGRHGGPGLTIGRKTMQPIYDFVDEVGDQPFFVWYAPFLPHRPHNPPDRLLDKYAGDDRPAPIAKYYAMCEWFDETVGDLLGFVDRQGLRENTLVVFVVDNGWIQPTGETPTTRGPFAPRSKLSPYDGGVRTPVTLRWPGRIEPGYCRELISTVDLAPTILRAAGLSPTASMPGVSLLDRTRSRSSPTRDAVFGEIYTHDMQQLEDIGANVTHQWVRARDWKLINPVHPTKAPNEGLRFQTPELYHLGQDPMETQDVASRQSGTVRDLLARLKDWKYRST
ncbi:MAG: sulfatase-like hydrolase/transferase [Salinivenus sp.]